MMKFIRNEFIKEYTIKKIIITILLFMVISITTYTIYSIDNIFGGNYGLEESGYVQTIDFYNRNLDEYKKDPTVKNLFSVRIAEEMVYILDFFYHNDKFEADVTDWRYDATMDSFDSFDISALKLIAEGYDIKDFNYKMEYADLSKEEALNLYEASKKKQQGLFKIIETGTYKDYALIKAAKLKDEIEELNKSNGPGVEYELEQKEEEFSHYQNIANYNVVSKHDSKYAELTYLESLENNDTELLSEDKFYENQDLVLTYQKYADYKVDQMGKLAYLESEKVKTKYAIESNIKYHSNEYKNIANNIITLSFIIAIFVIARAGKVISDEHNTGSIRLLLTQGVSRNRIFISKVISIFIDIFIHYFVFALIFILIGLFFYNINDLLSTNINLINGKIVLSNYVIDLVKNIFITTIPMYFIMSLSIFISVLSWNTIASVGVPLFINLVGSSILGLLRSKHIVGIIPYTPFPYLDLTKFIPHFYGSYPTTYAFVTSTYNITIGIAAIVLWTLLLLIISMIAFNRRDIVND